MDRPENYPSITVLICTLNKEENLAYVLPKIPQRVDETIIADGHSISNAVEPSEKIRPEIEVLFQPDTGKGML